MPTAMATPVNRTNARFIQPPRGRRFPDPEATSPDANVAGHLTAERRFEIPAVGHGYFGAAAEHCATASTIDVMFRRVSVASLMRSPFTTTVLSLCVGNANSLTPMSR
jgi:hypothetical protein